MSAAGNKQATFFGHPMGLAILFFTEMWERFSYYGMRAILVYFMMAGMDADNAGYGWSESRAYDIYGWYTMAVYLISIPGGIIADRWLGQKKSVLVGGLILVLGHFTMAFTGEGVGIFILSLSLIVAGTGLLKPNISTMVGGLYGKGDERRDKGFMIFYIGINLGAFLATLLVGYVGEKIGWHYGFSLAGFGMLLGQIVYMAGQKHLKDVGNQSKKEQTLQPSDEVIDEAKTAADEDEETSKKGYTKVEKDRLKILGIAFFVVMIFWMGFEQAGSLMSVHIKDTTDRIINGFQIPASNFQSLNSLFIMLFGGVVATFWVRRFRKGKFSSSLFKMGIGTILLGLGFLFMYASSVEAETSDSGKAGMYWIVLAFLFHTIGELCLSPVALSYITKLAPKKIAASVMGIYFAFTGLANKLASEIAKSSVEYGEQTVFLGLVIFCAVVGLVIAIIAKPLQKLTHGAEAPSVPEPYPDDEYSVNPDASEE